MRDERRREERASWREVGEGGERGRRETGEREWRESNGGTASPTYMIPQYNQFPERETCIYIYICIYTDKAILRMIRALGVRGS